MKIRISFFITLYFVVTAQAWLEKSGDVHSWLAEQRPKNSVYIEMNKYFSKNDPETDARPYIQSFVNYIHNTIISEADTSLKQKLSQEVCKNQTQISFPEKITQQYSFKSKLKFEKQIVKVQSYDCLGNADARHVFETLLSAKFQLQTIDGMKATSADQSTNRTCQTISLFPLGTSNTCFTQNILSNPGQYVIHSFNEENINNPSAPVYFRESIVVITQLKNGNVSIYTLSYGRGPDLPFHGIVEKVIYKQQKKLIDNLNAVTE